MPWCRREKDKKYCTFTLWHDSAQEPYPRGHDIFNFGRPYYILTLSDLGLEVERKILKEIMFFHTLPFMATPLLKNPWS